MKLQILSVLFFGALAAVSGFYIDSAILGALATPALLYGGSLMTLGTGKLLHFLLAKPKTTRIVHVTPTETYGPYGPSVVNKVNIKMARHGATHYPDLPLGVPILMPRDLQHPVYRSAYPAYPVYYGHQAHPAHRYRHTHYHY
ncbi:hypothetical protein HDE_12198 [Halotydeus destructor]|nr:hypothetical protein HDE_12198 [Halotydeus destructor]